MANYAKSASGVWLNLDNFASLSVSGSGSAWYVQAFTTPLAETYDTQAKAQDALDAWVAEHGEAKL